MNRFTKYTLAAVAMLIAASCAKEIEGAEAEVTTGTEAELVPFTLNFQMSQKDDAKSYIDNHNICWEATDSLAIYVDVGGDPYAFTVKSGSISGTTATFEGLLPKGTTDVYAVYPYSAAKGHPTSTRLKVNVPGIQLLDSGRTIAKGAIVSVAAGKISSTLTFKNVFGVFKVTINQVGNPEIESVGISGNALAGEVTVDADGTIIENSAPVSEVKLAKKDGSYFTDGTTCYIAALPSTTPKDDFEVVMTCKSSINSLNYAAIAFPTQDITIEKGNIRKFDSNNDIFKYGYQIYSKDEFELYKTKVDSLSKGGKMLNVFLRTDIDYGGASITPVPTFRGNFYGNNHCIYNYKITDNSTKIGTENTCNGFFVQIDGDSYIRDLNLGMDPNTGTYDGVSFIKTTQKISGTDNSFSGGLAGLAKSSTSGSKGVTIDNINNYARIEYAPGKAEAVSLRYGGIIGQIGLSSSVSIINCKNYGEIVYNSTYNNAISTLTGHIYEGGIVGFINSDGCSFEGCENHGKIGDSEGSSYKFTSTTNLPQYYVGGICGRHTYKLTKVKYTNCKNCADATLEVHCDLGSGHTLYMGGIVGADVEYNKDMLDPSDTYAMNIDGCANEGEILLSSQTDIANIGGIAGMLRHTSIIQNSTNSGYVHKYGNCGTGDTAVGGIVGVTIAKSPVVQNCTNGVSGDMGKGEVKDDGQFSGKNVFMGGMVGKLSTGSIISCTNYARVGISGPDDKSLITAGVANYVGGLVGYMLDPCKTISGSKNYGTIYSTAKDYEKSVAGGLIGYASNNAKTTNLLTGGCYVDCDVQSAATTNLVYGLVIGKYASNDSSSPSITIGANSEGNRVVIAKTCKVNGTTISTTSTDTYYWEKWMAGPYAGITKSGTKVNNHIIWAELEN